MTGHPHVRAGGRLPRVGSGDPYVAWTGLRRHGFRRRGRRRGWGLDARRRQVASPQDQERHRERSQRGSSRHRPLLRSLLARALSLEEQTKGKDKTPQIETLEGAARWSVKSNLRFARVHGFCEWLLEKKKLDAQDAAVLQELMKP